jgi:hypothetical protein
MNIPEHMQSYFNSKVPLFLAVDETLSQWTGEKCFQLPLLLEQVSAKMGWGDDEEGKKQLRANDPVIRDYIRNHSDWYITRGAGGGIMRSSERQKKEEAKLAKVRATAELNAQLDAQVAAKKAATASAQLIQADVVAENTNI